MKKMNYIDLFAGLGGFRIAFESIAKEKNIEIECKLTSEIDKEVIKTYKKNFYKNNSKDFNKEPVDITKLKETDDQIPEHDILFAGFPCQAFSNAGKKMGFLDKTRGTLFFDIVRILKFRKPKYILLENVKHLTKHNNGETWKVINETLRDLGYLIPKEPILLSPHLLNIPQERYRVFIPGVLSNKAKTQNLNINVKKYFKAFDNDRKK